MASATEASQGRPEDLQVALESPGMDRRQQMSMVSAGGVCVWLRSHGQITRTFSNNVPLAYLFRVYPVLGTIQNSIHASCHQNLPP